jgi:hypothetical protein
MSKTCREQVQAKSFKDDLDFKERVLKDAIRDRAIRNTAFWEWVDLIAATAKNCDKLAASDEPIGIFKGQIPQSNWSAFREQYRIAACAYRELLQPPDVKEAMGVYDPNQLS